MRYFILVVLALCSLFTESLENTTENCSIFRKNKSSNFCEVKNKLETSHLNLSINVENAGLTNEEKGKLCLKNVTKCLERDLEYRSTTDRLASFLFSSLPPFDLSRIQGVSKECRRQSKKYVEDLQDFQMWALKKGQIDRIKPPSYLDYLSRSLDSGGKFHAVYTDFARAFDRKIMQLATVGITVYDSTAKIPSGILNGNLNQLGDFDMCLAAVSEKHNIHGQYCLAELEVQNPQSSYLSALYQLVQSHHHFRSKLEDPGHRVPRFSSINWALCVPSACSSQDVSLGVRRTIQRILNDTEIDIRYNVDPTMCQTRNPKNYPTSLYITLFIFVSIIAWEILATLYDFLAVGEKNKWIMAFSIKENLMSNITLERSSSDIETIHGIRFLNSILLLASHKSMAYFFQPSPNRTDFVEYIGRPFSVLGRAASLWTDPFIMISGLLTTYTLVGRLNRTQKMNVIEEYISRLCRIVPTFVAVIAFCTFILPFIDSGPMWNLVVTHHSDICKRYWWRNLLFIHNYFGFKDMCLTHTHHLGIDTQLFFVSPFLIYLIWRWPRRGATALVVLATISTLMRYHVTLSLKLSNYVHFGTSVQQLFDTADNMYILPAHRATVYIMGIILGYILRNQSKIHLSKIQLNIGSTLALFTFCISLFGPAFMSKLEYVYNPRDAAWYAAVFPILWCFSFGWIIFTWHLGYKIIAGHIFSNKLFLLWTKISYTVYLTQFPIYFYNVGITRSSNEAGFFWMILSLREYAWVVGLSIILTLLIELPFYKVRQVYLKSKGLKRKISTEPVDMEKVKKL